MILASEEADYGKLEVYDWGHLLPADRDNDAKSSIGWGNYVGHQGRVGAGEGPIPTLRDLQHETLQEYNTPWSVGLNVGQQRGRPTARVPRQPPEPIECRRVTAFNVGGARDAAYRARSRMPGVCRARRQCSNDPGRAQRFRELPDDALTWGNCN